MPTASIKQILSERFAQSIDLLYGGDAGSPDPLITATNNPDFGDYQANVAMSLAKKLGEAPRSIASAIVDHLELDDVCSKIEIAGPGFINLHLEPDFIDRMLIDLAQDSALGLRTTDKPQKIVIDYSAPNIAKEMHVGHLRSTVIGDAIARILARLGHTIIPQNHMGDWGTQFGMLIEYLVDSGWRPGTKPAAIRDLEIRYLESKKKFDTDSGFRERARQRVGALQSGDEATLGLWRQLVAESTEHFNTIYNRLGVLLEMKDNCPESFYNPKLPGVIQVLSERGLLETSDGASVVFLEGFRDRDDNPLPLIVKKRDGG